MFSCTECIASLPVLRIVRIKNKKQNELIHLLLCFLPYYLSAVFSGSMMLANRQGFILVR